MNECLACCQLVEELARGMCPHCCDILEFGYPSFEGFLLADSLESESIKLE